MYKDFSENKLALLFMLCGYALLGVVVIVAATLAVYVTGAMLMVVFSVFTPIDFDMTKIMMSGFFFLFFFFITRNN